MRTNPKRHGIQCSLAAITVVLTAMPAYSQLFWRSRGQQCCPPCYPQHCETAPVRPDMLPSKDKDTPQPAPAPDAALDPGFDPGTSVAGLGQTAAVPNIFGSQFGRSGGQASATIIRPGFLNGRTITATFQNATEGPPGEFTVAPGAPVALALTGFPTANLNSPDGFTIDGFPAGGGTIQVFPGSPPLSFAQISALLIQQGQADLIPLAASLFQVAANAEMTADPTSTLLGVGIGPVDATATPSNAQFFNLIFNSMLQTIVRSEIFFDVPSPAAGGNVGRTPIAEDNNPLPQDRIIFNYDYFDNTSLTRNGVDVNRFVVGVEKTFFNQLGWVQVRPAVADSNTELGNLHILLKVLLLAGQRGAISAGMGISTPTADDTQVGLGPVNVVRIENESVILSPFIAAMVAPTERTFAQIWTSFDFDANGNPVLINPMLTPGGLTQAGRLNDQTLMLISGQLGFWAYQSQNASAFVRALAPFVELHYIAALGDPDIVRAGNFTVGNLTGNYHELDVTTGVLADLGPRGTFSVGVVAPLRTGNDRTFDYQIGGRLNIFFGPTLQTRQNTITPFTF